MRWLAVALLWVLGCAGLAAQSRSVKLELENGATVEGRVVRIEARAITVAVGDAERTFAMEQIRKCVFGEVEDAPPPAPATESPPLRKGEPDPAPASEVAPKRVRSMSLLDRRLQWLDRLYPWLFPAEPMQWISLAIMLFALLSLAVHLAARLCATDFLNFGRALAIGFWLLVSGLAQLAVVPATSAALTGVVLGNVFVLTVLFGLTYALSLGASILATLLFAIEAGLGFALLQLVDATLRSIGNATF